MRQPSGQRDVVGVLLAAGVGSRFAGGNKLLAQTAHNGKRASVVGHSAEALVNAPVDDAVAVLGHEADRVATVLDSLAIETVHNSEYEIGQATSLHHGIAWARRREADAVLVALGDMPWVAPSTYRALLDNWRASDAGIVVPTNEGKRGNPVVFDARHFDSLEAVSGDTGGRSLLEREPVRRVAVDDPGIHRDVDQVRDVDTE